MSTITAILEPDASAWRGFLSVKISAPSLRRWRV